MSRKPTFRTLLAVSGMTQATAAEQLGVSHRMLQYWLSDRSPHQPPPMALDALRWRVANPVCQTCGPAHCSCWPQFVTPIT